MANYSDNIGVLASFSPYVQQLPIQEMYQVGAVKQAQYNEGVQRIQASIDNVAGLDVVRNVDKKYLQSKMDELGNNLKSVAAGDFSNFQLVNSTAGMVGKIAKDKTLLDKLSDTQKYKRDSERISLDIKDGKDNPANTLDFQTTSSEWLNGDLNSSYSGRYLAPRDVWKKIKDVAESIGVNSEDIQNIFQTDSLGNPVYREVKDKTGKIVGKEPIFNDIAVQKITKGKDPEAILRAFQNALSPDDFQQLSIDGKYRYANYSPQELKGIIATQYDGHIRDNKNRLSAVELQLAAEKNKGADVDPARLEQLEKLKQYYEQADLTYKTTKSKNLELVNLDPASVRGSIYTNSYLETMAKALSPKETTLKYEESPSFKIKMEVDKFNEVLKQNAISNQFKTDELALRRKEYDLKKDEYDNKLKPTTTPRLLPSPVDKDDVNSALRVEDEFSTSVEQLDNKTKEIALTAFRDKGNNKSLSDKELEEAFNKEAEKIGRGTTVEEKRKDHTNALAQAQLSVWKQIGVPANSKNLLSSYSELLRNTDVQKEYIQNVEKEVTQEAEKQGINVKTISELKTKVASIDLPIQTQQGVVIQRLSSEDVLDFAQGDERSERKLGIKFGNLYSKIKEELKNSSEGVANSSMWSMAETTYAPNPEYWKAKQLLSNQNYKALNKIKADIYKRDGDFNAPTSIAVGNWEEKESGLKRNDEMDRIISNYKGENDMVDYDGEKLKQLLVGEDSKLNLVTIPGVGTTPTKYVAEVTSKDGKERGDMFINELEYNTLSKQAPPTQTKKNAVAIKLTGRNITGGDNYDEAFFQESDFANINSSVYSVTGNYEKESGSTGNIFFKIYVKDKQKGGEPIAIQIPIPIPMMTPSGGYNSNVMNFPATITTANISQLIKNK